MKAKLRQVRISPKKMNLVASMVRGKSALEALETLKFTNKKAADILYKLVASAVANAEHNFKQDPARLTIDEIIVNDGITYKRRQPISRGRAHPILKRTSNVWVTIGVAEQTSKASSKGEKVEEEKKDEAKKEDEKGKKKPTTKAKK